MSKKSIESLIGSVFVMQALEQPVEFELGQSYKFEVKFTVKDEHLELEGGGIWHVLREASNGELESKPNT